MDKKLYLSQTDKRIAGVCGGLGEFFGIDSTVLRIAFVLLVLFGGGGILAYLVIWLIAPRNPSIGGGVPQV